MITSFFISLSVKALRQNVRTDGKNVIALAQNVGALVKSVRALAQTVRALVTQNLWISVNRPLVLSRLTANR